MKLLCRRVLILLFIFFSKIYCQQSRDNRQFNELKWKGGSYGAGADALQGRSKYQNPVEVNHAPAEQSYKGTPYAGISGNHMPAFAMLRTDHQGTGPGTDRYITTGNARTAIQARAKHTKMLKRGDFAGVLKAEITETIKYGVEHSGNTYEQGLVQMVNYAMNTEIKGAPLNANNERKLLTKIQAKNLLKTIKAKAKKQLKKKKDKEKKEKEEKEEQENKEKEKKEQENKEHEKEKVKDKQESSAA